MMLDFNTSWSKILTHEWSIQDSFVFCFHMKIHKFIQTQVGSIYNSLQSLIFSSDCFQVWDVCLFYENVPLLYICITKLKNIGLCPVIIY